MRKLGNIEKVAGHAAYERARAVFVIKLEGQLLHMRKQVAPHIRLYQHAHPVPDYRDNIAQRGLDNDAQYQRRHHREKHREQLFRQKLVHRVARHEREDQIYRRDEHRAQHIYGEQPPVLRDISDEYFQWFFSVIHHSEAK